MKDVPLCNRRPGDPEMQETYRRSLKRNLHSLHALCPVLPILHALEEIMHRDRATIIDEVAEVFRKGHQADEPLPSRLFRQCERQNLAPLQFLRGGQMIKS